MDEKHFDLEHLISYRQGTLAAAERESVQEHLSLCPACTRLLLELKEFEAGAAGGATGPEPLRQEAWESLAGRLPRKPPTLRPIGGTAAPSSRWRPRSLSAAAAAALLLAVAGLSVWAVITVQQSRQRLARLEQRLEERDAALAGLRTNLAETRRQLSAALGQIQGSQQNPTPTGREQPARRVDELEARIAELTSELEEVRRATQTPERQDQTAVASRPLEVSVAPRFALRGGEPSGSGFLRGEGAVNPIRPPEPAGRFTVTLSLADHPIYGEYRLTLIDRKGKALWTDRRRSSALLGDAGTSFTVNGLGPGLYRLRIEGLQNGSSQRLDEYLLEVGALSD